MYWFTTIYKKLSIYLNKTNWDIILITKIKKKNISTLAQFFYNKQKIILNCQDKQLKIIHKSRYW